MSTSEYVCAMSKCTYICTQVQVCRNVAVHCNVKLQEMVTLQKKNFKAWAVSSVQLKYIMFSIYSHIDFLKNLY